MRQHGKGAGSRFQSKAGASNKYRQSRSRGRFRRRAPPALLLCICTHLLGALVACQPSSCQRSFLQTVRGGHCAWYAYAGVSMLCVGAGVGCGRMRMGKGQGLYLAGLV